MSIRKLFDKQIPQSIVSSTSMEELGKSVESSGNITARIEQKNRFIPQKDYSKPQNFARFGSAERYYNDSFDRIANQYPYDGSLRERVEYLNNSNYLDLYVFDNVYPRTTGYATISPNGWGSVDTKSGDTGLSEIVEYIQVVGGPHTASSGMLGKDLSNTFESSNFYDPGKNRESNLKFDFTRGVTLEAWIKKEALIDAADSDFETIFHLTNDETGLNTSGSLFWALDTSMTASAENPVAAIYTSGTISERFSYPEITTGDLIDGNWHHLAVSFQISGTFPTEVVLSRGYLDGELKSTTTIAEPIYEVTGALIANVGAMRPMSNDLSAGGSHPGAPGSPIPEGSAKLSGSIDEFRYWKTARTSEEIGRYWFTQYGGGTNKDDANTDLGVYLKFNEGITGILEIDSVALDYSGRISNGAWVGYTPEGRSTGSAIDLYLGKESEFKDPIIYPLHPEVAAIKSSWQNSGSNYDLRNNSSFYYNMPSWIIEEDDETGKELSKLSQILSSYLDTLYLQIESYPTLKDVKYPGNKRKPLPFAHKLLEGFGLTTSEIFVDADILEQISNRDEDGKFDLDLTDIKNLIYRNIYNNLVYIYKSKGSMKSFRNLMRCYGIDTDLVKINLYGDNATYRFRNNFETRSTRKKYIDFNDISRFEGSIYQYAATSPTSDARSFITASGGNSLSVANTDEEKYTSLTLETEVIFPKKLEKSHPEYFSTNFITSSLFGFHSADPLTPNDYTWPQAPLTSGDYYLRVYAVREELESNNVYFVMETATSGSTASTLYSTSSLFYDVYDNNKWNFAFRVYPTNHLADAAIPTVGPGTAGHSDYTVELYGINSDAGSVANEFLLSQTFLYDPADDSRSGYLWSPKRIYAGAERTNFTGSVRTKTDIKLGSVRYWTSYLDNETIKAHARDPENFGTLSPGKSTYLYPTSLSGVLIPQMETLALNWEFNTLTGSDATGEFLVPDLSSGSVEKQEKYSWMGEVVGTNYAGKAEFFPTDSKKVLDTKFIYSGKQTLPENIQSADMIDIDEQDNIFKLATRPVEYFFAIEKSMYQNISEEILNVFATIIDFNTSIGDPVNRYRQEYKQLEKLRQLFFERVQSDPDLDRYINFYKWIDNSLSNFLNQLIPASAKFSDNMRTMVESHVLERNKYWTKFPTLDFETPDIEGGLNSINELLYDWKSGHHPVSDDQSDNCFWWKERAEREGGPISTNISSGDANVDSNRNSYLSASLQVLNRSFSTPYRFSIQTQQINVGGSNFYQNKSLNYVKNLIPGVDTIGGSTGVYIDSSSVEPYICRDQKNPAEKRKLKYGAYTDTAGMSNSSNPLNSTSGKGDRFVPFTIYSSSYVNSYSDEFVSALGHNLEITNLHDDSYGATIGTPMQGPFTEKFVGGRQVRHVDINSDGSDSKSTRPESWQLKTSTGIVKIARQPIGRPRAMLYRDQIAKRPVNIRNIKMSGTLDTNQNVRTQFINGTLVSNIGNYTRDYEVVQAAGGRTANNRAWVKNGPWNLNDEPDLGVGSALTASIYVGGMYDEEEIQRGRTEHVFVCRFSAPGGPSTMGDSNGGPGLDRFAAELSPNNDLNWRNNEVRDPLRKYILAPHVKQFGYYSGVSSFGIASGTVSPGDYSGPGSFYQINRNSRLRLEVSGGTAITSSAHDNYYVQRPIPATDLRYSWITASLESISPAGFGYWPKAFYVPSLVSPSVPPVTFATTGDQNLEIDFAGINTYIYEPIPEHYTSAQTFLKDASGNPRLIVKADNKEEAEDFDYLDIRGYRVTTAGSMLSKTKTLNALNLHRNGAYQHPSWKQVRTGQTPIARYMRRNNFIGCTGMRDASAIDALSGQTYTVVEETVSTLFYEPAVQNISVPLEVVVAVADIGSQKCGPGPDPHELGPEGQESTIPDYTGKFEATNARRNVSLGTSMINTYGFINSDLENCAAGIIDPIHNADVQALYYTPPANRPYGPGCLYSDSAYGPIIEMIKNLDNPQSPIDDFIEAAYTDKTFPAPMNKYKKAIRARTNYRNNMWRSGRKQRGIDGATKTWPGGN